MSEWIIVAVVGVVLLFSAKKLPDMARGLGQSMRIFKAETRGMKEDDQRSRSAGEASAAPAAVEPPAVGPGRAAGDPVGDTAPATSETRGSERS